MSDIKVALVTGAGTGIGKAAAYALLDDGWLVALVGRRLEVLSSAAADSPKPANCIVLPADVAEPAQVAELFERIEERFGRLDLLFNNAGVMSAGSLIDEMPIQTWLDAVSVNLTGSFLCARSAFGLMRRQEPQGGRIINNGSISAHAPRPGSVSYTATKHAITGLTKSLALDGRAFNIACGQIDIGNALSDMAAPMAKGVPQADGSVAVEATMSLDDIGKTVAHMASLPLGANVLSMTIMATKMPFVGRG